MPGFELVGAPGVPGIFSRAKGVSAHGVLGVVVAIMAFKLGGLVVCVVGGRGGCLFDS